MRLVTDSPIVALYFRSLLQATPLYSPQAFPRTLTVYAATAAGAGISAAAGMSAPFTVVDCDPATARATVLTAGPVPLAGLREAVAAAAGSLQSLGGYRHVPGGSHVPIIAEARKEGVSHWYFADGHYYAPAGEAHPDLLPLRCADVVLEGSSAGSGSGGSSGSSSSSGSLALVLGASAGGVAGAAAAAGRLCAAHDAVWEAGGLAAQWAGLTAPAAAKLQAVRGALSAQGGLTVPLQGSARLLPAPGRILVVAPAGSAASASPAELIGAACRLSAKQAEKLQARLAAFKGRVEVLDSEAAALKALGL